MRSFDVTSICNALMDILIEVDDTDLQKLGLTKGIMHLVDSKRQADVLNYFARKTSVTELGGSSLNAIRTLSQLGHSTFFAGMISDDLYGARIKSRLDQLNIASNLGGHATESTGTCIILITPDGERTMNTNLGASRLYTKSEVPKAQILNSRIFHFSGYQWDTAEQKNALLEALELCKKNDKTVSFDLADPFVVDRNRTDFEALINDYADIVFANKEEAKILYHSSPEIAAAKIASSGAIAVVKLGGEGAMVCQGDQCDKIAPVSTKVIDTTGAGDMFAAGFLHGVLKGQSTAVSGKIAATLASDVISRVGATVSKSALDTALGISR
jgi:sugar/nucleoside kinase (ribokinase family)